MTIAAWMIAIGIVAFLSGCALAAARRSMAEDASDAQTDRINGFI